MYQYGFGKDQHINTWYTAIPISVKKRGGGRREGEGEEDKYQKGRGGSKQEAVRAVGGTRGGDKQGLDNRTRERERELFYYSNNCRGQTF